MSEKTKISIVIPVYNPPLEYFRAAIACLTHQTLKELEIILVDDCGSRDAMKFAEEIALKDARVRVLRNERNLGPGFSRNRGIEEAKGEYLSFFDADDLCDHDFYERLYGASGNGDVEIVKAGVKRRLVDGKESVSRQNEFIKKGLKRNKSLFTLFVYEHVAAIYKTEFIRKNKIEYGTTYSGEDTTFLLRSTYLCKKFRLVDDAYYIYRVHASSITNDKQEKFYRTHCEYLKEQIAFLNGTNISCRDYVRFLAKRFNKDEIKTTYNKGLAKSSHPPSLHIEYLAELLTTLKGVKYLQQLKFCLSADMHQLIALGPSGYICECQCPPKNITIRITRALASGFRRLVAFVAF